MKENVEEVSLMVKVINVWNTLVWKSEEKTPPGIPECLKSWGGYIGHDTSYDYYYCNS
jgi:hypothetical protein